MKKWGIVYFDDGSTGVIEHIGDIFIRIRINKQFYSDLVKKDILLLNNKLIYHVKEK